MEWTNVLFDFGAESMEYSPIMESNSSSSDEDKQVQEELMKAVINPSELDNSALNTQPISPTVKLTEPTYTNFRISAAKRINKISKNKQSKYVCDENGCNFSTENKRKLDKHAAREHKKKSYKCDYCDMYFSFKDTKDKHHVRAHTGIKNYLCSYPGCEKKFHTKQEVLNHEAVHQMKKPYKCKYCDLAYGTKRSLANHLNINHQI